MPDFKRVVDVNNVTHYINPEKILYLWDVEPWSIFIALPDKEAIAVHDYRGIVEFIEYLNSEEDQHGDWGLNKGYKRLVWQEMAPGKSISIYGDLRFWLNLYRGVDLEQHSDLYIEAHDGEVLYEKKGASSIDADKWVRENYWPDGRKKEKE